MHWWKSRREQLEDEIQTHVDFEIQENIDAGMSPKEARHAAMQKFGNVLLAKERAREIWGWVWLERLLQDVRYAFRGLRNAPGYAVTVVLTLALGLGSVTAMLAIVDSVLLRPVALPHPEQLVMLSGKAQQDGRTYALSYPKIDALRHDTRSFTAVSGYNTMVKPVGTSDGTRMAVLTEVTPQFFKMLDVRAKLGRVLGDADEKTPVVMVSALFWKDWMHGDPKVIGSTVKISGQLRTVIGVLPEGIHFPLGTEAPVVYMPIATGEVGMFSGDAATVMARMKPGVSPQQAFADASSVFAHSGTGGTQDRDTLEMHSYKDYLTGDMQRPLLALLGGVAILLLISCANAANLQIARATGRMPEMNVRSALGASFGRLLQQVATESAVLSLVGAALGGALAYALIRTVKAGYGSKFARFDELTIHPGVFGVSVALALLAGVLASLAPALSIRRHTDVGLMTKRATQRSRLPGLLVALQIALTCVLLVTSGLFVRTLRALQDVKLGFDPRGVTTMVLMPEDQHIAPEIARQTVARLLERFAALPGIESATMQSSLPFSNFNVSLNGKTDVNGRVFHEGDTAFYSLVSANFVRASGIDLLRGRGFMPQDDSSGAAVVLINQAFVNKFLAGRDPLGTSITMHRDPGDKDSDIPFTSAMTVVGVVENDLQGGDLGAPFEPMVYMDYMQLPISSGFTSLFSMVSQFAVRSTLPQAAVDKELREAIKQVAPNMAELGLQPMDDAISGSLQQRRLALRMVTGFGGVALILSAIGIYGVLAYSVSLRRREIGVRMALGSSRAGVVRIVFQQAGKMVLLGLVPGAAAAWAAGHGLKSFLFGVKALDLSTLGTVAAVLLLVCAMAAAIPALRAAEVDPMEALRAE
ncbi:ADOP family duplicated permease [Granulicella sp. S156]|uniref:ADOP family duplicated permease n=1 Tax=Granulicella sp. S156 TaxID=1747224 RepID=UPI00131EB861|nr:ADOP family duplicated permease [Granulicella sp. S156]